MANGQAPAVVGVPKRNVLTIQRLPPSGLDGLLQKAGWTSLPRIDVKDTEGGGGVCV